MLWSLLRRAGAVWFLYDLVYVVGVIAIIIGLWLFDKDENRNGRVLLTVGWCTVLFVFLLRFAYVLSGDWGGMESHKIIGLARSVLHTVVAPLAVSIVWCLSRLIYDQIVGRRKWWQTAIGLTWMVGALFWTGRLLYFMESYYGTYPGESMFP